MRIFCNNASSFPPFQGAISGLAASPPLLLGPHPPCAQMHGGRRHRTPVGSFSQRYRPVSLVCLAPGCPTHSGPIRVAMMGGVQDASQTSSCGTGMMGDKKGPDRTHAPKGVHPSRPRLSLIHI